MLLCSVAVLCCGGTAMAQSVSRAQVPATPPTTTTSTSASTSPAPQAAPQAAHVLYQQQLLTIEARNSSLNQTLREIARLTGLKITGGVREDVVFGKYGPGPLGQVLSALLEGTGSNLMLVQSGSVAELVLTPRTGGPTPPSPSSYAPAEPVQEPATIQPPTSYDEPHSQPVPPPAASADASPAPPAPAEPASTDSDSASGTRTPQQVYQELLKMQQATQPKTPQ
ncbi:MAG: hypothetical protein KGK08_05115 [Acidobacteriota bacterium]|nr:hypothetical protein [Acidobacteriota bacterium]